MIKMLKNKLISKRGESILEVLCALLIMVLIFAGLTTAVVAANRINRTIEDVNKPFTYTAGDSDFSKNVSIEISDISPSAVSVISPGAVVTIKGIDPNGSGTYRFYSYE